MIVTGVIRKFGDLIKEAENQVIDSITDKRIETEPSITDRFLGAVENIFDQQGEFRGYRFRARTLRDRGPGAAEHREDVIYQDGRTFRLKVAYRF